ncbi:MAG: hypothetical protein ACLR23_27890 [Clostridia bacterium]
MKLTTQYLNPIVLRCAHFDGYRFPSKAKMGSRIVYDYEIELYLRSGGGIEIDGRFVPLQAGDVNIRKPGQQVKGVLPYECTTLCIDFLAIMSGPRDTFLGVRRRRSLSMRIRCSFACPIS